MDFDKDSEISDFWEEFSEYLDTESKISPHKRSLINQPITPSISFEESINQLRSSKYQEGKHIRLDEQQTIRNYIKYSISKITDKLNTDITFKRMSTVDMNNNLLDRHQDFRTINTYLIDREVLITQHRILHSSQKKVPMLSFAFEKKSKTKELAMIRIKIEALKRAALLFKENAKANNEEIMKLTQEFKSIIPVVIPEPKRRTVELKVERIAIKESLDEGISELEEIEKQQIKELEALEKNCEIHKKTIESLQYELKIAKKVLQNPGLKTQVCERLQDYLEEFDGINPSEGNSIQSKRRRVYSAKATSNLTINIASSNVGLTPKSSKFKFYFRKPTLDSSRSRPLKPEYQSLNRLHSHRPQKTS